MLTVLLTGFAPFGGEPINPSERAVRVLAAEPPPGLRLVAEVLPVSYATAAPALRAAVARCAPDVVLATGLASGRAEIAVERIAINIDDAPLADNDGVWRTDTPVVAGGPAAYFATVPIKAIAAAVRAAGVPAAVSQSAGTFLCNHVFYLACHLAATERAGLRVGFLHLPLLPEQAVAHPGQPSMAFPTLLLGLRAALEAVRDHASEPGGDLRAAEGAIS
jgi:pyroglutamyl-peptidase